MAYIYGKAKSHEPCSLPTEGSELVWMDLAQTDLILHRKVFVLQIVMRASDILFLSSLFLQPSGKRGTCLSITPWAHKDLPEELRSQLLITSLYSKSMFHLSLSLGREKWHFYCASHRDTGYLMLGGEEGVQIIWGGK